MTERYFDEIEIGEEYLTPGITVTEYQVMQYAGVSTDFWEPHTNEEFAKGTRFGRRIAHGLLGLALADGLKNRSEFKARAVGALHWSWDFVSPIFIGDTVHVRFRVADKRPSRHKPDCGVITLDMELINQRDEITQRGQGLFLVERKTETPSTAPPSRKG
jgi:acyl dehydratase